MSEEEMKKMLEEMSKYADMPKPIRLTIRYDKELQKIIGHEEDPTMMSEGVTFGFLLHTILTDYPEIKKRYPPGILTFSINGIPPKLYSPLLDGDMVMFSVSQ